MAIEPSKSADPATLVRRVYLDLIGLPPSPDEVAEFVADDCPDAYERLVDRLLASPHYGERWARPWLDLCHYADSDGYLTDQLRPVAWRYRAWLVEALNRNLPFDEFTVQQLAGDLIPQQADETREEVIDRRIATGFLRQTLSNREGGAEPEEFRVKQVVERTNMVGTIWLGLTVACARCHDHKYDPIKQHEFFGLYAYLNNADEVNIDAPLEDERDQYYASLPEFRQRHDELVAPYEKKLVELQKRWEAKCLQAYRNPAKDHIWDRQWELLGLIWGGNLGEGQMEGVEIVKLAWKKRSWRQRADLLNYFLHRGSIVDPARFSELKLGELRTKLTSLRKELLTTTRAPAMQATQTPRQTYIHEAGDFRDRGADVEPHLFDCLPSLPSSNEPDRLRMAQWLVADDNPLTARVTVNRAWQNFFGRGIVQTTEDFGTRGERPSHPMLLDWLAHEFHRDWDVKQLHRTIVSSATYRQSSRPRDELRAVDPNNVLLARQHSLRLPAETIRDSALATSGLLCRTIGGPTVKPPQSKRIVEEAFGHHKWEVSTSGDRYRRGLYTFVLRTAPFAQSITFDAPNPNEICTRRVRSNTPMQALTLLNDPVFYEMATAMAERVCAKYASDDDRVRFAFQLATGRTPAMNEQATLRRLLAKSGASVSWVNTCSVLLNLHEFVTRD